MVGKRPSLPLRLMLRAFQPVSCRISVFCSWRKDPPDLLCRRQTLKRPIKRALSAAEWRKAQGVTVVGCARREAIGLAERDSANPEGAARARATLPAIGVSEKSFHLSGEEVFSQPLIFNGVIQLSFQRMGDIPTLRRA